MLDCIFCQIAHHQIDSTIVYENEEIIAFEDIDPQARIHILIIPKRHISTLLELKDHDIDILQQLFLAVQNVVVLKGVEHSGFRLVFNCNPDGGQTIYHLHAHILGGRKLDWPPG